MKVLHIINSLATGGAEKLILETLPIYEKQGIACDLALLDSKDYPFKEQLEQKSKIRIIQLSNRPSSIYNPFFVYKIMPLLRKYDLVHVHLFPAQYFVALAKLLSFSKARLIFTEHNTLNRRIQNPKFRRIERIVYAQYERVICISEEVKLSLMKNLGLEPSKLEVIQNGISIREIQMAKPTARLDFNCNDQDVIIVMVGGFRPQKDQDTVIRAIARLPISYKLLLIGDGERRDELSELVSQLKLANRVHFLGIRTDVYEILKMADIVVMSSHWEGFGLAAAEAMACGTPVLASNVDGLAQVVQGGGKLFEKGNEEELSDAILNLASDKTLYEQYKAMGIEKSKQYDIQLMINQSILLYKNVVNG